MAGRHFLKGLCPRRLLWLPKTRHPLLQPRPHDSHVPHGSHGSHVSHDSHGSHGGSQPSQPPTPPTMQPPRAHPPPGKPVCKGSHTPYARAKAPSPARPKRRGDGQPEREGTSGGGSVQIDARVARAAASGRAPPALGCPSRGAAACVPTTRRRRCRRRRPGGRGPAGTAGPARRAGPSPPAMAEAPRCH